MHLCMNAWPGSTDRLRTLNIIHEGAHAFSWMIGDTGYFTYATCEETGDTAVLGTALRLGMPDAFSCFVSYLRYDSGIIARAESYRGSHLALTQAPPGPIDLNGPDPQNPMFQITGIPDHSGMRLRWMLADASDERYLLRDTRG